jgi:hypothetical protein
MRNILNINSDWMLSTEKRADNKSVHKRILPLNKEDEYCYYLELLGASSSMEVFMNQEKIGTHNGIYTLYRIDVTDYIVNGDNELDIVCDGEVPCLDASLIIVGKYHFSLDHFGDAGLTVIPQEISSSSASIRILASAKDLPEDAMISYTVLTTTGTMLANKSVPATTPEYICRLTNPCLWNGKTSPKLYVVVAGLIVNGTIEDQIVLPFGLRNLKMESGSDITVNGLCIPENDLVHILESDPFVYDDMDEDGTFACVELKELCNLSTDEADCKNLLTEYVLQNAYHPSILCWKLPEEHADFATLLRELDSTRPVLF